MSKKIAILFRGPIRPTYHTAINNIKLLMNCLTGYETTTYLWAWDSEESRKVSCDINVFEPEPNEKFIYNCVKHNMGNSFKQYWVMKRAIEFINNREEYDYIVQSRTDTKIVFDNLDNWFDKECYVTSYFRGHQASYVNDQIGIATPEIMHKAWDYINFDILDEFTKNSQQPEDVLDQMIVMNGVKLKIGKLKVWELNENRHFKVNYDQTYYI